MNSFRKLIPVAAAALMLGLGTNAFSQTPIASCNVSTYGTPELDCSTETVRVPANQNLSTKVRARVESGTLTADFKVVGTINREVYWAKTISNQTGVYDYIAPLNTRYFTRWIKATGSNLRGDGSGIILIVLSI
jgi:hypothetical protein